jgi:Cyclic nucleotide-binding domain
MTRVPEPPEEDVGEAVSERETPQAPASDPPPSSRLDLSIRHRDLAFDLKIGRYGGAGEDDHDHARRARFGWARRMRRGRPPYLMGGSKSLAPEPPPNVRLLRKSPAAQIGAEVTMSFWDALGPRAKHDFLSRADQRTFAAGSRLMQEGETADHVIVILTGHAEIWVDDGGRERLVTRRGPGQLIGERAALQVSVRSATAIAVETVHALSMTTEHFARFVSEHAAVLDIVEGQIYERLTESLARQPIPQVPSARPADSMTSEHNRPQAPDTSQADLLVGQYCLIIYTDVVGFGDLNRTEDHRDIVVRKMREVTEAAMAAIWAQCAFEGRGDGLLIVVPPSIPPIQVLEYLLIALPIGLKRHNALYVRGAQMRLRVALDVGPVTNEAPGVAGRVVVDAARLLEAKPFKKAVLDGEADLGIIASDFVYQSTIKAATHLTDPLAYARVDVEVKETVTSAWMTLVSPPVQIRPPQDGLVMAGRSC